MGHCGAGMGGKKLLSFSYCCTMNEQQVDCEKTILIVHTACKNNVQKLRQHFTITLTSWSISTPCSIGLTGTCNGANQIISGVTAVDGYANPSDS